MSDYEIEKVKYVMGGKSEVENDLDDASDKIKAGAKVVANRISDPDRDPNTQHRNEKLKEKLD